MSQKKILIVDDEAALTRMIRMNLEKTGRFTVREENRSTHALSAAREFRPDLILLDVIMPGLDGGELAAQLQADASLQSVPIIFLTATVSKREAHGDGLTSGGFRFLAKPVSLQNLLACMDTALASAAQPAKPGKPAA